jgi:hypothetical protein
MGIIEIEHFAREYGLYFMIGAIFLWLVLTGWVREMFSTYRSHRNATEKIDIHHISILDPTDPEKKHVISRHQLLTEVKGVGNRVDKVHQAVCDQCGSAQCPMVPILQKHLIETKDALNVEMSGVKQLFIDWTDKSLESRRETQETIKGIYDRLNGFIDVAMAKLLVTLEKLAEFSTKNRD